MKLPTLFAGTAMSQSCTFLENGPYAMKIWRKIGIPVPVEALFRLDVLQWLKANYQSNADILSNGVPRKTVFTFTIWALWKHKNMVAFKNTTLCPDLHSAGIKKAIDYSFCNEKSLRGKSMRTMQVQWIKPREGWFKLNTDGASLGSLGKASGGGLVRDHKWGMVERIQSLHR